MKAKDRRAIRVALLHNIFAPYREGLFEALAAIEGIDLEVSYCAESMQGRDWDIQPGEYKFEVLSGVTLGHNLFFNLTIVPKLLSGKYDAVIVAGYHYPTAQMAMVVAKMTGMPLILCSVSPLLDERMSVDSLSEWLKYQVKRLLVSLAEGYIVSGMAAKRYLENLGADASRIHIGLNSLDIDFFAKGAKAAREDKERIKAELGIGEGQIVLYIGRLVNGKGLRDLLKAFAISRQKIGGLGLLIVGDGPSRETLQTVCKAEELGGVHFTGFQQKERLPLFYGISDLLVLPSAGDVWGYVVSEAMACRLPVIVSDKVGCAEDLIQVGNNGYVFEGGNSRELANKIVEIFHLSPQQREYMGQRSLEIIGPYSHEYSAQMFAQAIRKIVDSRHPAKRVLDR